MKIHRIALGWLFVVIGTLLFLVLGMTFVNNIGTLGFGRSLISIVFIVSFFLMSFSGYGLLRNKMWAYLPAQIAAYINIVNFPIGTVLAIYYIWFYRSYVKNRT
ncbi:hypothetical protein [Paraglaciecola sp. 25GB23A]|uniref:hypothetical protein n=1 Tax=Paraglaciecola sp. 25GB23A TaxID=3156068 RepID=UPI0032AFA50B